MQHGNVLPKSDASKSFSARDWLAIGSGIVGGKGGGKDDTAKGIGSEVGRIDEALEAVRKAYAEHCER